MVEYQRTGRKMRLNHSNAIPRYIIAYHVETNSTDSPTHRRNRIHNFGVGHAVFCRIVGGEAVAVSHHRFTNSSDWWLFLYSKTRMNQTTWVVSHNALHDMIVSGFAEEYEQARLVLDWPRSKRIKDGQDGDKARTDTMCVIEAPPTIIACRSTETQGRIVIVDTQNWFPIGLADLERATAGTAKITTPNSFGNRATTDALADKTATILTAFVELGRWVKANDMGMFRYTGAAQSMAAYRHRFMESEIYCHDNAYAKQLERSSYYGGRTEVFIRGAINTEVWHVDVNSLFPSVMLDGYYPYCLDRWARNDLYSERLPDIEWHNSVAEVAIDCNSATYPNRLGSHVIYPVGRFLTVLCGIELARAKRAGVITHVRSWASYRTKQLFKKWVTELWAMRQKYKADGNQLYDQFTKRLLNSLYGKFGQMSPAWINCPMDDSALPWQRWVDCDNETGVKTEYRSFGYQVQKQVKKDEIDGNFPAISAFITAAARDRMDGLRLVAGKSNVLYQGVDGLIVNRAGYDSLCNAEEVSQDKLGKLKIEMQTNCGEIIGCADYRLGDRVVISGLSGDRTVLGNGEIIQRKRAAVSNLFSRKNQGTVEEIVTGWNRQSSYCKGVAQDDGMVVPFELNESATSSG